jgi:hypothetical protein
MDPASGPRHSPSVSSRNSLTRPLIYWASGIVVGLILVLASLRGSAPAQGAVRVVIGPTEFNSTDGSVVLSFPNCTNVSIHWQVIDGGVTNFSVWENGYGPPSESYHCGEAPGLYCPGNSEPPGVNYGASKLCFQIGTEGNISFTSTHPTYWVVMGYNGGNGDAGHSLILEGNYSCSSEGPECSI